MTRNLPFDAYIGDDPFIFVSYSHDDSTSVFTEIKLLRDEGYRIWYDEGIAPGKEWPEEIEKAILKCSLFVAYITTSAVASKNVRNEVNLAIEAGKTILAIYLEKTNLTGGLRLQISSVQGLMKYQLSDYDFRRKLMWSLPKETRGLDHEHVTSGTYQHIFISYSHKDSDIVDRVEKVYAALGLYYLRDTELLMSGQDWNQAILDLIHKADVFQLFWSTSASHSKYVEKEWRYSLSLVQSGEKSRSFIRPVYWERPMPNPPKELAHLHFAYIAK